MSSTSIDHSPPHQLLALDLTALGEPLPRGWRRLGDRISAVRRGVVLVHIGATSLPGLPEPDYVIDSQGTKIIRHPSGGIVEEWVPNGGRPGVAGALEHIADALLINPSEIFTVVGPAHDPAKQIGQVIVAGGEEPPSYGLWVPRVDDDGLIAALAESQFFADTSEAAETLTDIGYRAALDSVRRNITPAGFTAASIADNPLQSYDANYASVWARDGVITGLWTLPVADEELIDAFRATLRSLARHQSRSGQIPSNVRVGTDVPDYSGIGGIASVDSVIWFVIGAIRFAFHTNDRAFAEEIRDSVDQAMGWLSAHDANNDGLIEIPESSDWMDIFPRSYNVLYDEILWMQACRDTAVLHDALGDDGSRWAEHADRIEKVLLDQFWPSGEQLMEIAGSNSGRFSPGEAHYLLSQITPFDYGWRCDVYANLLAALSGVLDERRVDRLFQFLWGVGVNSPHPVACLYPPVASGADDWKDYFLVNFLNIPHHYHNGGIWPFIGGLWVRFLVAAGRVELARRELAQLAEACRHGVHGEWEFNEWLHGTTGRPMGKAHQAWSAASYLHAYLVVHSDVDPAAFPALDPKSLD